MKCVFCKKTNSEKDFIYETKYWRAFLADEQSNLGRCVIMLKRHCEDLAELEQKEWLDFSRLVKKLESSLKRAFNATMFNWACLMNNAYQDNLPKPHVHWHFRSRYKHKVKFADLIFEDKEFGHHYDSAKKREVSDEVTNKIIEIIKESL